MRDKIEVNGRSYSWPNVPLVVVCIDGSEPDYIEQAVKNGVMPFTEEILKFCIIFFYCSRLDDFDEPMDGLVYGATAALGFAMAENFDYVYNAANFNSTWQEVAWVRALSTAPMHAACGAMIGFAISYYRFYNKNIIFLLIGILIAIIFVVSLDSLYN